MDPNIEIVEEIKEPSGMEGFVGRHLLLDVQTSTPRGINETTVIYRMLEGLSKALDMTLVYPPLVARFPFAANELERFVASLHEEGIQARTVKSMEDLLAKRQSEDAGISGVTVWLESHAAIHTWTEENFFSFDAYSCKDFDPDEGLDYVLKFFDVESYNGLDIIRTIDAPQQVRVLGSAVNGAG
ncbi:MAG: S-adenosylmethionine decarboxylase [Gammaproteobacteria bacterium]|nr:S-adenosylmethionine decarboxylase [Gammaproteobacteria bacterium]